MNQIFRVVWHQATQAWVVVSELSRQKGKSSSTTDTRTDISKHGVTTSLSTATLLTMAFVSGTAFAAPPMAADIRSDNQHFISVAATHADTNISTEPNYDNKGAKAPGSIAIGTSASVAFEDRNGEGYGAREAIAIGQNAKVKLEGDNCTDCAAESLSSEGAIAIGRDSVSGGRGATSIGLNATSTAQAVAIGNEARSGFSSVALGVKSKATQKNGVAIGSSSTADFNNAIAIGTSATALKQSDLAVGDGAKASGGQGSAFGVSANASNGGATAIGGETNAAGYLSTSVGYLSKSSNTGSFAGGARANANGSGAISIGMNSTSLNTNTTALGAFSNALGPHSTALGAGANTTAGAWYSLSVGSLSRASVNYAMATGHNANASAEAAIAMGPNTTASATNAVAIGSNTTATHINGIALGANSVTKESVPTNEATVNGVYYSGFAAKHSGSVVSVGYSGFERQIVNVAAGQITSTSTDAINGSQLYQVASGLRDQMPVVYTTAAGKKAVKKPDGKFYEVDDAGNVTTTEVPNGDVIASMNDGNSSVTSPMALANIKSTLPDTFSSTTNPKGGAAVTITNAQAAPTLTAAQYNYAATLGDVLNAGWNLQANGSAVDFVKPYDTVNFASSDNSIVVTPTTDGSVSTIDLKANTTTLAVTDGKVTDPSADDGKKLVNATTVAGAINNSGWNLGNGVAGSTSTLVKPSDKVNFVSGKGTESIVKNDPTTNTTNVTFNVKPNGTTINVTDDGVSVNTGNITKASTAGANAGKVTVDAAEQGKVATVDNVAEAINSVYWKVGDNASAVQANIGAGNQVDFVNGNGTTSSVKVENGVTKISYDVNYDNNTIVKDANGKLSVNTTALPSTTVGNTDGTITVTKNGNDYDIKANTTALTNSNGKVSDPTTADTNKLVNATTVANAINNSGWNLGGNDTAGSSNLVKPSDKVNFVNGKGTESVVKHDSATNSNTIAFNVKANGTTINVTDDGVSVNTGNITAAQTTGADAGKVTVVDAEKGKVATVGNIAEAINSVHWKVGDNAGDVKANITAGNKVDFVNGNGTTSSVKVENGVTKVSYDVDYDNSTIVKDANGKLSVNTTALPSTTVENTDGSITVTQNGNTYDVKVNTTELTNTADGKVNVPAAADGGKVVNATTIANIVNGSGWTATATANGGEVEGTANTLVKPGSTVNYIAGTNIKLKQNGSDFTISTTDKLTAHEVEVGKDGQNGVNGVVGVKGKDGASVTVKGEDGSITLVSPKAEDGSNGASITIKTAKGTTTVADKDGGNQIDRMKYTDGNGNVREVATLDDGLTFTGDDGQKINRTLGNNLNIKGGAADSTTADNIRIVNDGANGLKVNLANNVTLDSSGSVTIGDTKLDNDGLTTNNGNGPSVKSNGISAGNKTITNVAPGVNPTDAVNVSQLGGLKNDIQNINNRVGKMNKENRAGIAGANAAASLPQVYIPGKSMVAASGGTFKGQNAFAVGYSRASDNGKLILKLQGNANTQGDVGGGVGVGYQW